MRRLQFFKSCSEGGSRVDGDQREVSELNVSTDVVGSALEDPVDDCLLWDLRPAGALNGTGLAVYGEETLAMSCARGEAAADLDDANDGMDADVDIGGGVGLAFAYWENARGRDSKGRLLVKKKEYTHPFGFYDGRDAVGSVRLG